MEMITFNYSAFLILLNLQIANCDFPAFIQEKLQNFGELSIINLGKKLDELFAWHRYKQINPIFQWEITKKT
jgi:hypothetical protein